MQESIFVHLTTLVSLLTVIFDGYMAAGTNQLSMVNKLPTVSIANLIKQGKDAPFRWDWVERLSIQQKKKRGTDL